MGGRDPGDDPAVDPAVEMMGRDDASAAIGVELLEVRPGYARVRLVADDRHVNGHDIVHGGYLFLLADTAFACACNSGRSMTVAATAEIDFIRTAHRGDVLEAEAVERAAWGRSGITDVTVLRVAPAEALVAEFRGRSRTVRDA